MEAKVKAFHLFYGNKLGGGPYSAGEIVDVKPEDFERLVADGQIEPLEEKAEESKPKKGGKK